MSLLDKSFVATKKIVASILKLWQQIHIATIVKSLLAVVINNVVIGYCNDFYFVVINLDVATEWMWQKSHIATLHVVVIKIIATTPYVALVLCTKLKVQILIYHIYFFDIVSQLGFEPKTYPSRMLSFTNSPTHQFCQKMHIVPFEPT